MEKAEFVDLALSPLILLERSRGWKRRGLVFLYGVALIVMGVFGWRALCLWRLPDMAEPFDEAKFGIVAVADADNAMIAYREAASLLRPLDRDVTVALPKDWNTVAWSQADPRLVRFVEENRHALEPWLRASDRPDALLVQPRDMRIDTLLEPAQALRVLARLAILEGFRLEEAGDLQGAWRLYRGALRSSRHAGMHGSAIQRLIGRGILASCRPRVLGWAADPRVTPEQLRRAIADVEACMAMTSPNSEMIRVEYFACRAALNRTDEWRKYLDNGPEGPEIWYNQLPFGPEVRRFLVREPERSLRVLRLITAGALAQCDRPRAARAKLDSPELMIYDVDPRTPPLVAALTPEDLAGWARRSAYPSIASSLSNELNWCDAEAATFDQLRLGMAERAFTLEKGKPPSTYGDLVGRYLKALPDGLEPEVPIIATSPPTAPK